MILCLSTAAAYDSDPVKVKVKIVIVVTVHDASAVHVRDAIYKSIVRLGAK